MLWRQKKQKWTLPVYVYSVCRERTPVSLSRRSLFSFFFLFFPFLFSVVWSGLLCSALLSVCQVAPSCLFYRLRFVVLYPNVRCEPGSRVYLGNEPRGPVEEETEMTKTTAEGQARAGNQPQMRKKEKE